MYTEIERGYWHPVMEEGEGAAFGPQGHARHGGRGEWGRSGGSRRAEENWTVEGGVGRVQKPRVRVGGWVLRGRMRGRGCGVQRADAGVMLGGLSSGRVPGRG